MTPMVTKVSSTPFDAAVLKCDMSSIDSGGTIRKPFDEGGYRRDVADAETAAAQHAVTQVQQPQLVQMNSEGRHDEAAAETDGGGEHGFARADRLDPAAEQGGGRAQERDCYGENPDHIFLRPVAGHRLSDSDELGER